VFIISFFLTLFRASLLFLRKQLIHNVCLLIIAVLNFSFLTLITVCRSLRLASSSLDVIFSFCLIIACAKIDEKGRSAEHS
jgi:hypothetical protein